MKKTLIALVALGALMLVTGLGVAAEEQSYNAVTLKIPFAFYAGDQQMPAGQYVIDMPRMSGFSIGSMVKVSSPDGSKCQFLFSSVGRPVTSDNDFHLIFNKYGDTYFLSRVRNSTNGAEVGPSGVEKRLAKEYAKTAGAVVTVDLTGPVPRLK